VEPFCAAAELAAPSVRAVAIRKRQPHQPPRAGEPLHLIE
jgi:hypothetical protein